MKTFSIGEAFSAAWKIFKANWLILIAVVLLQIVFQLVPSLYSSLYKGQNLLFTLGLSAGSYIMSSLVGIGIIYISLKLIDGQTVVKEDIFRRANVLIKLLIAGALYGIFVTLGFLLFIIPGIILAVRWQFVRWAVVDSGLGPMAALSKSWEMTRGMFWKLLVFDIAMWFVVFIGFLAFGVGLLVAVPVTELAMAWVYRRLGK